MGEVFDESLLIKPRKDFTSVTLYDSGCCLM